jgi:hypothetical protein
MLEFRHSLAPFFFLLLFDWARQSSSIFLESRGRNWHELGFTIIGRVTVNFGTDAAGFNFTITLLVLA